VTVSAPTTTDIRLRIHTSEGYELHVVDSTERDDANCHIEQGSRSCSFGPFPALEAPKAGRWTVIVTKSSQPPTDVAAQVRFKPLSR
jgi:hypothetical protein